LTVGLRNGAELECSKQKLLLRWLDPINKDIFWGTEHDKARLLPKREVCARTTILHDPMLLEDENDAIDGEYLLI
jgi:hypothetical protein